MGTYFFDVELGRGEFWPGLSPLGWWFGEDTLLLRADDGTYWEWSTGPSKQAPATLYANLIFASSKISRRLSGEEKTDIREFFSSQFSRRHADARDFLRNRAISESIFKELHSCIAHMVCSIIDVEEKLSNIPSRHIENVNLHRSVYSTIESQWDLLSSEAERASIINQDKLLVLARAGYFRCPTILSAKDKTQITLPDCNDDYELVFISGQEIIGRTFTGKIDAWTNKNGQYVKTPISANMELDPIKVTSNGNILWVQRPADEAARYVMGRPGEVFEPYTNILCSKKPSLKGRPITFNDSDDRELHGFIYDVDEPKGVAVYLHGGPYRAFNGEASHVTQILVNNNIDVIEFNYPGTPGYGAQYLSRGLHGGALITSGTSRDLAEYYLKAKSQNDDGLKKIVIGASFGGILAINEVSSDNFWDSGILISAICQFSDVSMLANIPVIRNRLSSLGYIKSRYRNLGDDQSKARLCNAQLGSTALLALHGARDDVAPLENILTLSKRNPDTVTLTVAEDGSHTLSTEFLREEISREISEILKD